MHEIKLLSSEIINEIAAGEVIDRPVSVVKELIENSIDAFASKINIRIESGGATKILVSDNGLGIEKKYIETALKKHTTSKLKRKNLDQIDTLGFRGEALHAIANASEFKMISRNKNMSEAYEIKILYGNYEKKSPAKGNIGTLITVKNIFKKLPVRRKFLKSQKVESLTIKNFIKRISLAYPEITFSFFEDDKEKLNLIGRNGAKNLEMRVKEIYGDNFIKSSFYNEKIFLDYQIKMYASIPTYNKPNWQQTTIIINGRIIKDKLLLGVIKAAYAGLLAGNRFPVLALYINIKPTNLDVNVHPTKSEVRILNRNLLNSSIIKMIRNKLETLGLRYSIEAEKLLINKIQQNKEIKFIKANQDINLIEKTNKEENGKSKLIEENYTWDNLNQLGFAKAQINNMFIVAQTPESLILIDQHAAHERIVLETLKKNYYKNNIVKQILLIPVIIHIENGKNSLLKNKDAINRLGFIFEDYGDNSIMVREIPAVLGKISVELLFQDLNEHIRRIGEINPMDSTIEEVLSSIACHNSVRAGKKLNLEEMNAILRLMENTPNSGQCNHGRPTFIELKLKDIERLFGRI